MMVFMKQGRKRKMRAKRAGKMRESKKKDAQKEKIRFTLKTCVFDSHCPQVAQKPV